MSILLPYNRKQVYTFNKTYHKQKRTKLLYAINTNNTPTSAKAKKEIYVLSYPTWYLGWHVRILYFHTRSNFLDLAIREVFKYFLDTCKYWCSQVKGIEVIKSFIFSAKSTWVDLLLPHLLDLSRNNKINKGKYNGPTLMHMIATQKLGSP